jgi:hypothetical protein
MSELDDIEEKAAALDNSNVISASNYPDQSQARKKNAPSIKLGYAVMAAILIIVVASGVFFLTKPANVATTTVLTQSISAAPTTVVSTIRSAPTTAVTTIPGVPTTTITATGMTPPYVRNFTLESKLSLTASDLPPGATYGYLFTYSGLSSSYTLTIKAVAYQNLSDMFQLYNTQVVAYLNSTLSFSNVRANTTGGEAESVSNGVVKQNLFSLISHVGGTLVSVTLIPPSNKTSVQSFILPVLLNALNSTIGELK